MEESKKEWTSRFTPESIDEIINQKTIMFCDIAQPNTEFDAITVGRIKKDKTIEIISTKSLSTDLPYEERQKRFNEEVDKIAEQYNCLDILKDGSFNEMSNFEKSKRRERGINIVMAGRDFGKDRTMRHLLEAMRNNPDTPIIIASAGSVGKTCSIKWFPPENSIVVDDLVETTKTDRQKAQDFANLAMGDFKFTENFEQPKSKYHK